MTVTLHAAGRRAARRVSAMLAAIAVGASLIAASPAAASQAAASPVAAQATPSPSPTAPATVTVTAAPDGSGIVLPDDDPVVTVTVRNDTDGTFAAGSASVSLSRTPLSSTDALDGWLNGTPPADDFDEVARVDVADVAAGESLSVAVPFDPLDDPDQSVLESFAPGVYPVRVEVGPERARTVLTVSSDDAPARAVTVLVPITAGALETGLLGSARLAELTAQDGALSQVLDAVTGTDAVLAVDPAIPAAIRVLGTAAPASASQWLERLMALPNERFALQFGDADLAPQAHAGLAAPLAPTTLVPYIDPTTVVGATPAAAGDIPALTAVGTTPAANVLWPASGTAGADVVATLSAMAGAATTPLTLVPSDTVQTDGPTARARVGAAEVAVYDSALSDALTRSVASGDAAARSAQLTALAARATLTGPGALFIAVDRPDEIVRSALRAALGTVSALPGAAPASFADLRATPPANAAVVDIERDDARLSALTNLLAEEQDLTAFATVLVEPAQLTSRERTSVLQLLGNGWRTDAAAWLRAYDAHRTTTVRTLDAVGVDNRGTVNFLASNAPIPVTVRNELAWPISVVLQARTDDPRLIVQETTRVDVGADQNTRVDVPVEARVGSGEISLQLLLRTDADVVVGGAQILDVVVRAEWEAVGSVVLIVLVSALLGFGVLRTVLRLRRRRRARDVPGAGDESGHAL